MVRDLLLTCLALGLMPDKICSALLVLPRARTLVRFSPPRAMPPIDDSLLLAEAPIPQLDSFLSLIEAILAHQALPERGAMLLIAARPVGSVALGWGDRTTTKVNDAPEG